MVIAKCILPAGTQAGASCPRNAASPKRLAATPMIKKAIHKIFRSFGLDVIKYRGESWVPADFRQDEVEIMRAVRPFTMTSPERISALIHAIRYISAHAIPGSIVECGVWKGGSMAAASR